jgi:PKD repeat protein/nanoRNase/pAp phosphatase (c-di-AMP/oligoRNAs hydrolase)
MSVPVLHNNPTKKNYRLITRNDFDGLVCAVLLKEINLIEEILFVNHKDMQDGKVNVTAHDITTNLPYVPGAYLIFDHHYSETLRYQERPANYIIDANAPSTAHIIYNYYGGKETFPSISEEMLAAVDKADSGNFTREDILHPQGWVLLNYLLDSRSGLGQFSEFRTSNYNLMIMLIDYCKKLSINEILQLPDIKERIDIYFKHQKISMHQIERNAIVCNQVVIVDFQYEKEILVTNRFMIYAMYPECNISIHLLKNQQKNQITLAIGRSIVNCSSTVNIGELLLLYGGGGLEKAGTCLVGSDKVESTLAELLDQLNVEPLSTELNQTDPANNPTKVIAVEDRIASAKTPVHQLEATTIPIRGSALPTPINPSPLVAQFVATPSSTNSLQVNLDALASRASNGKKIVNYQWQSNCETCSIKEGVTSSVQFPQPGEYQITLQVTDNFNQTAQATQTITVMAKRHPPLAAFTMLPRQGPAPLTVVLDASNSVESTESDDLNHYVWSINNQHLTGKVATTTLTKPGIHTVILTVTNSEGLTASSTQTITVNELEVPQWVSLGSHIKAALQFVGLKEHYQVGEFLKVDLVENLQINDSLQRVDLWVAVETSDGKTYFMTGSPFQPFSPEPQPFRRSLEQRSLQYRLLEFEVPPNMGGNYSFYAIYNKEGADLNQLLFTQRSNLAFAMTVLSEQ